MIVKCFGVSFKFVNPIITIGSISFDVRKAEEVNNKLIPKVIDRITHEGELARLYLNILGWNESTYLDLQNNTQIIKARIGIDLATASYDEILDYLNNTTEQMSESLKELLRKVMKIKDSIKFSNESDLVSNNLKKEYQLIKNENISIKSLGQCGGGVLGDVRLDKSAYVIPKMLLKNRK
jgi:hypothetical protein